MNQTLKICGKLLGLAVIPSACNHDAYIYKDFKIYDLDGSNQAIIGLDGQVQVVDVTALKQIKRFIIFETGGVERQSGADKKLQYCKYGAIDTEDGAVHLAERASTFEALLRKQLSTDASHVVGRSCISKVRAN